MSLLSRFGGGKPIAVETKVGAAAGVLTAAAVLLIPVMILQQAVIASGLSATLPPLEPPLGMKARIGLALLAAGMVFGFVVTVVGLLGKISAWKAARANKARDAESAVDASPSHLPVPPKVRRRDRHPDAPARAPLSIGEVGLPQDEAAVAAPVATRMIRSGWNADAVEPDAAPEPVEQMFEAPFVDVAAEPEPVEYEAVFEAEPIDVPQPEASARPVWLDVSAPSAEARFEPESQPGRQPSLVELVERLERALERRAVAPVAQRAAEADPVVADDRDGAGLRLRDALESLKRFAPQRG